MHGLALRAVHAFFLLHGTLQLAAVDAHLAGRTVVGNYLHRDDGHVKVRILVETMHLVEFGHVQALLDQGGIFQLKSLALLEGYILHSNVRHIVEVVMTKLLKFQLDVGLDNAMVTGLPLALAVAARHVGEIQEII